LTRRRKHNAIHVSETHSGSGDLWIELGGLCADDVHCAGITVAIAEHINIALAERINIVEHIGQRVGEGRC